MTIDLLNLEIVTKN